MRAVEILRLAFVIGCLDACATVEGERRVSMGCLDVMSQECDDPTAYPPLAAMLPVAPPGMRPFPRLIPEQKPATPEPETPAGELLRKVAK